MENNKIKNTIVLRGMASNIVDEAIVILKPNVKIKKTQMMKNIREKNRSKEFILKEAEHIIEEYIHRISVEESEKEKQILKRKIKKMRCILFAFFILLMMVIFIK